MKMGCAIVIMNFSGAYEAQAFYKKHMDGNLVWVDLSDLQGTNCYCDGEAETAIRERIGEQASKPAGERTMERTEGQTEERTEDQAEEWTEDQAEERTEGQAEERTESQVEERTKGRTEKRTENQRREPGETGAPVWSGVHFLDSGNYHYASKLWLDYAEEEFELLVLDHHTDMQQPMFGDILSCGGWVRAALEGNPLLKKVYLAGPAEEGGREAEAEYGGRVVWISEEELKDRDRIREILKGSTLPLYLSLDKDILDRSSALTNWDQGNAALEDVLACIGEAAACRIIIGADICGEDPERVEQGESQAVDINDRTNGEILCKILEVCDILCP